MSQNKVNAPILPNSENSNGKVVGHRAVAERLQKLRSELNLIFLERENLIDGILAVLMAGGNAVLFGPPGCAKSYILEEICGAIEGATFFNRLLQKAQPPEELLGQPSLKELRDNDRLVRNTQERLPEAHIAFLDEIFRCNPTTLNALLRIINERVFENPSPAKVPLLFLCGAANDVPEDRELAAFVDRFAYRPWVTYCRKRKSRQELIDRARKGVKLHVSTHLTLAEIEWLQGEVRSTAFSDAAMDALIQCQTALEREAIFISDRKLMQLTCLLQCYAFVQGDSEVYTEHFHELLPDCLWSKEEKERQKIRQILDQVIPDVNKQALALYDAAKQELEKVAQIYAEYKTYPYGPVEQRLTQAGQIASKQLDNVERQIQKIISDGSGKNIQRAKRILRDIQEDIRPELGSYISAVF